MLKKIIVSIVPPGGLPSKIMKNKSWILVVQNHNRKKQLHVRRFGAIFGISPFLPKEAGSQKELKKKSIKKSTFTTFLRTFLLFQSPNLLAEKGRFSTILLIFNRILTLIGQAEDIRPPAQISQG